MTEEDIKIVRYFFENASSCIVSLIAMGFLLSLIYNFSYFSYLEKNEYLTLFEFSDYVESSLRFIVLIIVALFYAQIVHIDSEGIIGRFKALRANQEDLSAYLSIVLSPILKIVLFIFISILNMIIAIIQLIGVTAPYLVIGYVSFLSYLNKAFTPYLFDDDKLLSIIVVFPLLIIFDIFIAMRPLKYGSRKLIIKITMIVFFLSLSYGAFNASQDMLKIKMGMQSDEIFVRGIDKGAFFLDRKKRQVVFKPWNKIEILEK